MDGVRRLDTVDSRLRVHSQEATLVEFHEVISDLISLAGERRFTPGKRVDLIAEVADKELGNVLDRLGLTPLLAVRLVCARQANAVGVQLSKGRRARITPSTVGEFIPILSTDDI